jgi:hypothetical protein
MRQETRKSTPTVSPPFLLTSAALHSLPIETFGYIWGIIFCIVLFHNFDVQRNIQIIFFFLKPWCVTRESQTKVENN